MKKKLVPFWK